MLEKHEIFVLEADLNDAVLMAKLFDIVLFTHVLHLAAQAGVRYAMQNPQSYVKSNIAGFVNLLEIAKAADPQPSIVWASSSSVYGLNTANQLYSLYMQIFYLDGFSFFALESLISIWVIQQIYMYFCGSGKAAHMKREAGTTMMQAL